MGLLESLDNGITGLLGQWNGYSTALMTLLVAVVTYRIMSSREPDVHPLLLARQSVAARVRNEGESAVYRGHAAPHGMPLSSGLNVRDAGVAKYAPGRDGDLRDIWRRAASGGDDGARGRIVTVLGSEKVVEHKLEDVTRQINIIGRHIADQGGIRVALYLPNSVELLIALLACSFYPNLTTVLIPFDVADDDLISMLGRSAVDILISSPGAFALAAVVKAYPSLRQLIWVVDEGKRHMDWTTAPAEEGTHGSVSVATWQDIVKEPSAAADLELPAVDVERKSQDVVTFWPSRPGQPGDMVRFSQANLISGVAGQIAAIPTKDRLCASDLFLPADSLTNVHTLVLTLVALYSNASVALNSVAGRSPDLAMATRGIAPTVVVASPDTLLQMHEQSSQKLGSALAKLSHRLSTRMLSEEGVLAPDNALSAFSSAARPAIGTTPGKLRLIYVADRVGGNSSHLSSAVLSDLRIFTGARIIYALSAARVAGAVSQTALFDYRIDSSGKGHFGAPPACIEILLRDKGAHMTTDETVEGEVVARGPCVSGGEAGLGFVGKIRDDNTLSYI